MGGGKRLHEKHPHNQVEKLTTPFLDLGSDVSCVAFQDGRQLVYRSTEMGQILNQVAIFAPLQCDILIIAETGTGKELIARAIHERSGRKGPFVAVNCATIPEQLAESLLFGHVKGAFTGAVGNERGIFEEATGGTVFLDEFGDLLPTYQAKILRVLQERKITKVGRWGTEVPIDVRVIAATNRDLNSMVAGGEFRLDLIQRFRKDISIPPLRDRRTDILPLAHYFLGELLRTNVIFRVLRLSQSAERALLTYNFPGNIRELDRLIFLAAVETTAEASPVISGKKMDQLIAVSSRQQVYPQRKKSRTETALEIEERHHREWRSLIAEALRKSGGNKSAAASMLEMTPQALWNRMRRYGIESEPEEKRGN
jgi:transcriptional regulator with GAF, ATPase, and Fis domain